MSSVVLASQLTPATKHKTENPLEQGPSVVIPSVTHVFSAGQHLYVYFEVYDPGHPVSESGGPTGNSIQVLSSVAFFRGNTKTYETSMVRSDQLNAPARHAATFQLDIPLASLKPGFYTCQVNVIDDAANRFRFPRLAMLIRQ
jgi:hypothetical protein